MNLWHFVHCHLHESCSCLYILPLHFRGNLGKISHCAESLSHVQFFATPWTLGHQTPLSGILQARMLEWVAMPSSKGSSWPRNWTHVSCIGRWIPNHLCHLGSTPPPFRYALPYFQGALWLGRVCLKSPRLDREWPMHPPPFVLNTLCRGAPSESSVAWGLFCQYWQVSGHGIHFSQWQRHQIYLLVMFLQMPGLCLPTPGGVNSATAWPQRASFPETPSHKPAPELGWPPCSPMEHRTHPTACKLSISGGRALGTERDGAGIP